MKKYKLKSAFAFVVLIIFLACKQKNEETQNENPKEEQSVVNQSSEDSSDKVSDMNEVVRDEVQLPSKQTNQPSGSKEKFIPKSPSTKMEENKESRPATKPEPIETLDDRRLEQMKDKTPTVDQSPKKMKADPALFQKVLTKFVSADGKVNYRELKADIATLEAYTNTLSTDPGFEDGTRNEKLALWINTYNAYTLLLIAKHYPVASIKDIYSGKPWDVQWIKIGGKTYSLNQIENDIIRPRFSEPRIHFVLNCGAVSCPPLQNKVVTAQNLENMMEKATKNFLNSKFNVVKENALQLSSIFDWYRDDFGDVRSFVQKYTGVKVKDNAKITYLKYDWALNKA